MDALIGDRVEVVLVWNNGEVTPEFTGTVAGLEMQRERDQVWVKTPAGIVKVYDRGDQWRREFRVKE